MLDEARASDRDLELFGKRLRQWNARALHRDFGIAGQAGCFEQLLDHARVVVRDEAESIARLVGQPRPAEVELDVPRLLGRVAADDLDVFQHRRIERIALVVRARCRICARRGRNLLRRRSCLIGGEKLDDDFAPASGRIVIVDIAIDARAQAGRAELLEAAVDALPGLAIFLVGRIPEREHGEADAVQLRRARTLQELEEADGRLRRIALAIGADDEQDVLLVLELADLVVGQVGDLGSKPLRGRGRCERLRQVAAVAGLGAVEDRQRAALRRDDRRDLAAARAQQARVESGEIAADPARLFGRQRAGEAFDELPLVERQRALIEWDLDGHCTAPEAIR